MKNNLLRSVSSVLLFLHLLAYICSAQTPLNEVSDFDFHQQVTYSIIELESGEIVISGQALPKAEPLNWEAFFAKYSADFKLLDYAIFEEPDANITISNTCREIICIGSKVYTAHSEVSNDNDPTTMDISFIHEYDFLTNSVTYLHKVQDTLNGLGSVGPNSILLNRQNEFVLLLDNGGEHLWIQALDPNTGVVNRQVRHTEADYNIFGVEIIEQEEGYVVMGRQFGAGNSVRIFLWKLDEDFQVLKKILLDDLNYNHIYVEGIIDAEDNIVILTNQHLGELEWWRSVAIKFDADLNEIWTAPVGGAEYGPQFSYYYELVESHDKDGYLFCGIDDEETEESFGRGQIAKISKEGDSIWHRKYRAMEEIHQKYSEFTQIKPTRDGNYILSGLVTNTNSPQDSIFIKVLLLKIDEEGHIVLSDSTSATSYFEDQIRIFPNPSSDYIYVEHDEATRYSYELYNSQGALIMQRTDTEAYNTYVLSVEAYPSGIYYLHIIDKAGQRRVHQIVVARE